eukprot:scaffold1528_cov198-Pinguiococcus_pyrenoidosus.AAC.22
MPARKLVVGPTKRLLKKRSKSETPPSAFLPEHAEVDMEELCKLLSSWMLHCTTDWTERRLQSTGRSDGQRSQIGAQASRRSPCKMRASVQVSFAIGTIRRPPTHGRLLAGLGFCFVLVYALVFFFSSLCLVEGGSS